MIFIDSNIPMYLVGSPHQLKTDAQLLLERSVAQGRRLVSDVEVMQEIVHRFTAIDRRDAIGPACEALLRMCDEVFPIEKADAQRALEIVQGPEGFDGRDALHLAIMEKHKVTEIMSFDQDFDRWPGITRLSTP